MTTPPKGVKKQVLGGVLFSLGAIITLLAKTVGFELDIFYGVIGVIGACLFAYGTLQKNRHGSTIGVRGADAPCASESGGCCRRR